MSLGEDTKWQKKPIRFRQKYYIVYYHTTDVGYSAGISIFHLDLTSVCPNHRAFSVWHGKVAKRTIGLGRNITLHLITLLTSCIFRVIYISLGSSQSVSKLSGFTVWHDSILLLRLNSPGQS